MIIRAIKLRASTNKGEFGFYFKFSRNLNIVRGGNSSGKSTFFNSLLYGLGMEELVGGRGAKALPYAVKNYFEYNNDRIFIAASEVLLEVENSEGRVVTLRRPIKDERRDPKLVEVFEVAHLTTSEALGTGAPKYLHDPGSAQKHEGFFRFLEEFLDYKLPRVATTSGGETKLYLQAVFAAIAVEQKRGWTDYIANIPYYGIRDARSRVVEYLLGLEVFAISAERNRLNGELREIEDSWQRSAAELRSLLTNAGLSAEGFPGKPEPAFEPRRIRLFKSSNEAPMSVHEYIGRLRSEYSSLVRGTEDVERPDGAQTLERMNETLAELEALERLHEQASSSLVLQKASLKEYEQLLRETKEDLDRNKTAEKLQRLGAQHSLGLAENHCPTCHQAVENTLLMETVTGPQMDLATNVAYLESQVRMLERQIPGIRSANVQAEAVLNTLATRVADKYDLLNAYRSDVRSGATESRAALRRQLQIESEIGSLERLLETADKILDRFRAISEKLATNQAARKQLPPDYYSANDRKRIALFEKLFRANAGSFGYESANIAEIQINLDTLIPTLAQIELREIIAKAQARADIKADSSASDFVRLIWSYLLALYQTSSDASVRANHPGLLLLDEPGQHSMAEDSQHALLRQLASEKQLQSIVAASFDESESVFAKATAGVVHSLHNWEGKVIRPL